MENLIFETEFWRIVLADDQTYIGRSVIVLKRPCGDLADLTREELMDFHNAVKKLETAFRKGFDATIFNWTCLMNNAYQNDPPDPQVHWHFRPRYNHKVEFEGEVFEDTDFGHHYARGTSRELSPDLRNKLTDKIKVNL